MTCIGCESTNLVEGTVMDSNGSPVSFQFTSSPAWKRMLGVGHRNVVFYACVHCGLVQQRISFTDKDREKLARFDGPQPSVVDSDTER